MKRGVQRLWTVLAVLLGGMSLQAQTYDMLWKQVEQAQQKSLPQTVVKLTDEIYRKGVREQNAGQTMKAFVCREAFQQRLTPDSLYSELKELEQWAQREQNPVDKAVLHSLLAEKHAQAMSRNRRALQQRTAIDVEEAPEDVREWSVNLFVERIERHILASLQDSAALMNTSAKAYVPFAVLQDGSRYYDHDMYHLLASRAVKILGNYKLQITDYKERVDTIYGNLIRAYRQRKGMEDAVLLCEIESLSPLPNGEGLGERLDSLIAEFGDRELCAEVYVKKASLLRDEEKPKEALQVCDEGLRRYPKYRRINALRNLRAEILKPMLHVSMDESGYPSDSVAMRVDYRNVSQMVVSLSSTSNTPYKFYKSYDLGSSVFHKDTVLYFIAPQATGEYTLRIIPSEPCEDKKELALPFNATRFKVLTLELGDGQVEVTTLDASTGWPIGGANLHFYSSTNERGRKLLAEVVTDAEGKALLPWQKEIRSYEVRKGADCLKSDCWHRVWDSNRQDAEVKNQRLTLLTDRSLYRPGQTVYIKGIAYTQYEDSAHVARGADYELVLTDTDRKGIDTLRVHTNDFGSFAAEFTLPDACKNGLFSVKAANLLTTNSYLLTSNSVTFRVEEYKRPSFEVCFTPVAEAYQLGDTVTLRGNVKALNGRAVQDVPIAYTVNRYDLRYSIRQKAKPLLADTLQLDAHGDFAIPLVLQESEDEAGLVASFPRLLVSYKIEATVTDEAGETQSATYTLQASDKPFRFDVDVPQYVCKEESAESFAFEVKNQAGVVQEGLDVKVQQEQLPSGEYRLRISACDSLGHKGEYESQKFLFFSKENKRLPAFTPLFYYKENEDFDAQHPALFLLGTSYQNAYVTMNVFCHQRRIESRTLHLNDTIARMEFPYKAAYGEGVTLLFTLVRDGKVYSQQVYLKKRHPDRTLTMKWQTFRDRLQPGQEEEWRLIVKTPQGLPAAAEMLATMYDASLDKLYQRNQTLRVVYPNRLYPVSWNVNRVSQLVYIPSFPRKWWKVPAWLFDYFYSPTAVAESYAAVRSTGTRVLTAEAKAANSVRIDAADFAAMGSDDGAEEVVDEDAETVGETLQPAEGLRTDFAETAFFYPQLRTNADGEIVFSFTVPQSLTRWNFRSYSHTQEMQTGQLDAEVVTAKEFMLTPHMPRFVRVGDRTEISAAIANLTESDIKGTVSFTLFDPATEKVIATQRKKFAVGARRNAAVSFPLQASDDYPSQLGVRIIADGGSFSDGEQRLLPVLSDKEQITEMLAMTVRGNQARTFSLDSLFNRHSRTATDRRLTVEFTANPAWYAVQALQSLSRPATENAVSWASAWYADALADYVSKSDPRIKTEAGTAPEAVSKLSELQDADGGWSWFKGMPASRYITDYVTELLVRLPVLTRNALPAEVETMKQRALGYLHRQASEEYRSIRKAEKDGVKNLSLSNAALRYLYIMGISGEQIPSAYETPYRYFLSKVKDGLRSESISRKALSAVVLLKAGRTAEAQKFVASLKEHLTQTDERGAFFAFHENPYVWGMQPVPVHVDVMEALQLAGGNDALIEEMKLWLLKQKQTTEWDTPVATADAVYALLRQGMNPLDNSSSGVRITLGRRTLTTADASDKDLGYIRQTFTQGSPELKARTLTVVNQDEGIAWGAVYAQFLSPLADVKQQGGALNVEKKLYVERTAPDGSRSLQPLTEQTPLEVGDKVVSRITIRLDRAMDFLLLTDERGACFEPLGALSGYRRTAGFGYYAEVRDTATRFYFDHLGKGTYVLEHSYRTARGGTYEAGLATIRCVYAPEFASHSGSCKVRINR